MNEPESSLKLSRYLMPLSIANEGDKVTEDLFWALRVEARERRVLPVPMGSLVPLETPKEPSGFCLPARLR